MKFLMEMSIIGAGDFLRELIWFFPLNIYTFFEFLLDSCFFGDDIEFYSGIFVLLVLFVGGLCPSLKTRDKTNANSRVAAGLVAFKKALASQTVAA